MGKSLAKAGAIIAGAALIATGIGAAAGVGLLGSAAASVAASSGTLTLFGVSVATLGQVGAGLTALGSLTTKRPDVQTGGNPTQQTYDPQAGIPYPMGRTAVGGRIVYGTTAPANNKYRLFYSILGGGGPIDGIEAFYANNELVSFTADSGEGASGKYLNRMWQVRRLGAPGESYLRFTATGSKDTPADHGGNPPEWTSAHKFTGYAAALTACEYDAKIYAGDVQPLWVLRGVKVYDPRLDDTYPGGSGSCRALDESTYVYSTNPWLHALTFALGRWQNGKRVIGLGLPVSAIIVSQFVEAANVAEANGWQIGGVVYTSDVRMSAVQAMAQAGGGYCLPMGAQLGCVVNAPRVSIGEIRSRDIVGDSSAAGTKSRRDRINRIIGRYRSEAHNWEVVSAAPVEVSEHVAFDGGPRTREIDYTLVQGVDQVAQLARYDIENSRELEPLTFTLGPAFLGYRAGDCLTVNVPELGLVDQDVIVQLRSFDPATGAVTLVCRSETQAKHAYCLGQTGEAPPTPSLTPGGYAPTPPDAADWSAEGGVVATADGEVPVIIIRGIIDDVHADTVIVDYRQRLEAGPPAVYGDWTSREFPASSFAASGSDPTVTLQLTGLAPGGIYQVRVRYKTVRGVQDPETATDLGDVTTGGLVASDAKSFGGLTGDQIKAIDAAARKAQLDILDARMKALGDLKAFEAILRQVLSGKPLGEVIVEQRQVLINTNATVGENTAAIASEAVARQTAISAEAYQRTVLATDYSGFKASTSTSLVTLSTATSATAASLASVTTDYNGFKASASTTLISLSNATSATAASLTTLESTVAANKASADAGLLTVATDISALSTQYTSLNATVLANKASADSSLSVLTTNLSSTAASLTTLTSNFNSFQSSATTSLTTLSNAQSTQASQITALQSTAAGLSASVSSQASTLVDVTSKLAVARFVLEAAASGGRPARVSLESDSYGGSNIALTAAKIYWGDNTVFDDATDTLRTVTGSTAAVLGLGSPFGASADLLWWIGPSGVSLGAMSRANAYFYIAGSSPYIGGAGLGAGKEVKNAGGGFSGYIGAGVGWNAAAYIGLNIDAGPGSFMVSVNGVATRDGISSANAMGAWRLTDGSTTLASGYVTAFQSDGLQGTAFSALKKVSTTLTGSVTLTLEFQGVGGGGGDTGTVSGDVFVQYVKD